VIIGFIRALVFTKRKVPELKARIDLLSDKLEALHPKLVRYCYDDDNYYWIVRDRICNEMDEIMQQWRSGIR